MDFGKRDSKSDSTLTCIIGIVSLADQFRAKIEGNRFFLWRPDGSQIPALDIDVLDITGIISLE